jgi:hypothetical protein
LAVSTAVWELVFMMFVLKLPIAYLIAVVLWAIRSEREPYATVTVVREPELRPCPWTRPRRRPRGRGPAPRPRTRLAALR